MREEGVRTGSVESVMFPTDVVPASPIDALRILIVEQVGEGGW